ncbi:MAG: DUF1573 domain-containing protein [Planctomycetota bacterium]|nr:MAG: DUF1573 domain-containing protein [Planctomycetota bacterium]
MIREACTQRGIAGCRGRTAPFGKPVGHGWALSAVSERVGRFRCTTALVAMLTLLAGSASARATQLPADWAYRLFEVRSYDFGVVARGSDVKRRLKIRNVLSVPVHVASVRTTCGCSAGKPEKDWLQPGEESYVELTLDTRRFIRRKDSNLIVTFDQPAFAEVTIPLTAYIRTDVVLDPGSFQLGTVPKGETVTRTMQILYAGRNDWKIVEVRSPRPWLQTELRETRRAGGRVDYQLTLTVTPEAPAGPVRETLILVTDDARAPHVPVLVEGTIEPPFTVSPAVVSLGRLFAGRPKTFTVVVKGRKPFRIVRVERKGSAGEFRVQIPERENRVQLLMISIVPPDQPGSYVEEFYVTVEGSEDLLRFRAAGTVVSP